MVALAPSGRARTSACVPLLQGMSHQLRPIVHPQMGWRWIQPVQLPVTARKDDAPPVVQAAMANVAELGSSSVGVIDPDHFWFYASSVWIVTSGVAFSGVPACRRQPGDGSSPQHLRCGAGGSSRI